MFHGRIPVFLFELSKSVEKWGTGFQSRSLTQNHPNSQFIKNFSLTLLLKPFNMQKILDRSRCIKKSGNNNGAISKTYSTDVTTDGKNSPGATIERFSNVLTIQEKSPASTCANNSDAISHGSFSPTSTNGLHCVSEACGPNSNSSSNGNDSESITRQPKCISVTTGSHCTSIAMGNDGMAICCGPYGKAMAGNNGLIGLRSHSNLLSPTMIMGKIGINNLKPFVFYELDDEDNFIIVNQNDFCNKYNEKILETIQA